MTEKMQWKLLSAYEGFICDANLPKEIDRDTCKSKMSLILVLRS